MVIVDSTAPDTQITSGPAGEINVDTATFTFTGTDNLTPVANLQFAWRLNSGAFTAFSAATTAGFSGLAEGTYTFEVKARDLAGNEDPTPATRSFTVRFGPAITSLDPASGPVGTFVTIGGTLFEPGTTTVSFNGLAAVVRTVTATQITTTVPIGATTGAVMVTTSRGNASRTFTVTSTGDFTLTVAPASPTKVRVVAGDQGSARVDVGGSGSFASLVSLGVSPPPSGITASFSPPLVAPGSGSFLTLAAASTASPGTSTFTITGQAEVDGQSQSRTSSVTLEVLAAATPAVTGRVLTAEAVPKPIPGVTVTLGSAFTLTDAAGNFVLLAPPTGPNMLLVDGRTASTATAQYPPVEVQITVSATGATRVPFILYLPRLDTANPITLPLNAAGATTQEVRATTPLIPGLVVTIPQGTRINGPDGNPVAQIVITPVPIDRSPMPFPPGVKPPMLFSIQPGGAVPSQPLPITFPNPTRAAPGTNADLYFFDLNAGTWAVWGQGTVSNDGAAIVSNPGFGLPRFAWHYPTVPFDPAGDEGGPQDLEEGDPVDLATGRFRARRTDMFVSRRLGLSIEREYRSENPRAGKFGIGWTLSRYDSFISPSGTGLFFVASNQTSYRFTPDGPGRWVNLTDPWLRGAVITQVESGLNFELRFKDGTVYRYVPSGGFANAAFVVTITDRNGNRVTLTRGSSVTSPDRLTTIASSSGGVITLSYDAAGRITTVTDPIGRVVRYDYDAQGRLQSVTDPAGGVIRYAYDSGHRLLTITDARSITFVQNAYDPAGRVVRQLLPDGGVWAFEYGLSGSVVIQNVVTDPRGGKTTHRFDARGFPLSRTDALGATTIYEREAGSGLVRSVTDALGRTTRVSYDAQGNITSLVRPTGEAVLFTYEPTFSGLTQMTDEAGRITRFEYDSHGNLLSLIDPAGARTTHTYDPFGQRVTTTNAVSATTRFAYDTQGNRTVVTDPLGNTTRFGYDAAGRLARSTDPRGRTTAFAYSPVDRLTEVRDPAGGVTAYVYDPNGNLLSVTSPSGGMITRSYDALDRLASQTDPLGTAESFAYDRTGNLVSHTDRGHRIHSYGYDALARRITATYGDGTTTQTGYDALGRVARVDDSVAGTILNRYDARDRLVAQVTPEGTVSYAYDIANRRTRMDVSGSAVTYGYDANSRLTDVSRGGQTAHITYDPAGRRTSLSLPNALTTEYGYDAASRLTRLVYRTPAAVVGELTYEYNAGGHRIRIGGSVADTLLPPAVATATYDGAGRQLTFGDTHATFDVNGNATSISGPVSVISLTWDARRRLTAVTSSGVTTAYTYDGLGRRIRKQVNSVVSRYVYDAADIVEELTNGGPVSYLRSDVIDELLMLERPEGRWFPTTDGIGSTVLLNAEAGTTAARYSYEPFGTTISTSPGFPNAFRFTGRELDETGLYYYRARYYHPGLQRFISEDPLGIVAGTNPYSYANNNPVSFTDPRGLCQIEARFSQLSGGYHHAFIVTTDPNSSQSFYRGGPTAQGPSGGPSGALSSASGGAASASMAGGKSGSNSGNSSSPGSGPGGPGQDTGPWGPIATTSGPYTPTSVDWDPAARAMTVLDNDAACDPYDARFEQIMRDIQNASIPYNPLTTNSNAVVREALERAGFDPGHPPVWAPGWNTRLP